MAAMSRLGMAWVVIQAPSSGVAHGERSRREREERVLVVVLIWRARVVVRRF